MDKEQVKAAIKKAKDNFTKAKRAMMLEDEIIATHQEKKGKLADELLRYQGEFRALNRLLPPEDRDPEAPKEPPKGGEAPEATEEEGDLEANEDSHGNG